MVRSNKNTNTNRLTLTVYVGEDLGLQLLGWGTPQRFAHIIALHNSMSHHSYHIVPEIVV